MLQAERRAVNVLNLSTCIIEPYSVLMALLRCRLGFALLRASVMCLRGAQRVWHAPEEACASLAVVEARVAV